MWVDHIPTMKHFKPPLLIRLHLRLSIQDVKEHLEDISSLLILVVNKRLTFGLCQVDSVEKLQLILSLRISIHQILSILMYSKVLMKYTGGLIWN
jgi:hypothetical protein